MNQLLLLADKREEQRNHAIVRQLSTCEPGHSVRRRWLVTSHCCAHQSHADAESRGENSQHAMPLALVHQRLAGLVEAMEHFALRRKAELVAGVIVGLALLANDDG